MGRPKGARNIVGWQLHEIHRRLAAGDSPEVIAEAHGKPAHHNRGCIEGVTVVGASIR